MTRRTFLLLAVLITFSATGLAGTYEDKTYGFTISILPDWTQTPIQPNEKVEVAKWKDDRDQDFAELSIFRFEVSGGAVATESAGGEGDLPGLEDLPELPAGWGMPDNAVEYLQALVGRRARAITGDKDWSLPKPKNMKFDKDLSGDVYTFELTSKRNRGWGSYHMAGIVSNDSEEYLILYSSPRKLKGNFLGSIKSFRFGTGAIDEEEDDGAKGIILDCKPEDLLGVEKREKIKQGLVGTWRYIDTKHYIIIFNCDVGLAKYIAKRMEYMREYAYERVFPPVAPIEEAMVVRVCKEMDEYYHYGAPRGSAGYWASLDDELVFPDLAQSKKPDVQTVGVMAHEGFHQYIYYALLKHNPPVWFNEGYAEYFFCVNYKSFDRKRLHFDDKHPMRYSTVKNALGTGELVDIKDFIRMSQQQYYAQAQLCYSQGWAFATWLKNVTRNERYQEIPKIFFQEMQKGYLAQAQAAGNGDGDGFPGGFPPDFGDRQNQVTEDALNKAFEGIDLTELHQDFLKGLKRDM